MKLHRIHAHLKQHHKKYVGGLFAGFALVKTFVLLAGFFGLINLASTFAAESTLQETYFAQGSSYTTNRSSNTCNPAAMSVEYVEPGTDTIQNYLSENTLYVLLPGSHIITNDYIYPAHCSALIGSGDVTIYSNGYFNRILYFNTMTNAIVDNIKIDGTRAGNEGSHYNNPAGIELNGSSNNTISNSQAYNNQRGISIHDSSSNNTISNSQIYNNSNDGIHIQDTDYTTIDNSQIYNNSSNGIYLNYANNNTTISNSQVYMNSNNGIDVYYSNNTLINNSQVYNNNGYGIFIHDFSNGTTINSIQSYNNGGYGMYNWHSSPTTYYGTIKLFSNNEGNNIYDPNNQIVAGDDSEFFSGGILDEAVIAMSCNWVTNPINTDGMFLMTTACDQHQRNGNRSSEIDTKYLYGSNILKQTQTMHDIGNGTSIYSWLDTSWNPAKYIAEVNQLLNGSLTVGSGQSYTLETGLYIQLFTTEPADYILSGDFVGSPMTGTINGTLGDTVQLTSGYSVKHITVTYSTGEKERILSKNIGYISSLNNYCEIVTDLPRTQCDALVALYTSTNGSGRVSQNNRFGLGDSSPETACDWNGVGCYEDESGRYVREIALSENNLSGSIPAQIHELSDIQYLDLGYNNLTSIESGAFAGLSSLTNLYLYNNLITSIESGTFEGLSSVENLQLNNNMIISIESGSFNGLSSLISLYLNDNKIADIAAGAFGYLSMLNYLNLGNNLLTTIASGTFNGLSSLLELGLDNNLITTVVSGTFSELPSLQYLYINNNQISSIANGAFNGLSNLLTLNIYSNQIATIASGAFNDLSNIGYLDLDSNLIVTIVSGSFNGLSNLKSLYINNNRVTSIGANAFDGVPNLERLSINHNYITTIVSGTFSELPLLEQLDLSYNLITDVRDIAFNGLSTLPYLNLSYNLIASIASGAFNGLSNGNILDLGNNLITTVASGAFSELPNLQYLYLRNNQISGSLDIFCPLIGLNQLWVNNNRFAGDIPLCLTELVDIGTRGGGDIGYNYLNTDVEYSQELLDYLQYNYRFGRERNVQYKVADLALSGVILSLGANTFTLNLGYQNNGWKAAENISIQYDMLEGMDIETDTEYSTGKIGVTYGGFEDPCFADMYNDGQGAYFDLMEAYAEDDGYDNLAEMFCDREGLYCGDNAGAGKARADYIIDDYEGDPVDRTYEFDDAFDMDITNIPGCGTGGKDVYTFNIGTLDVGQSGAILITGTFSNHLKNNGFSNKTEILSSNGLRIDGATGNNTFGFTYNDGNIVIDTIPFIPVTPTIPTTNPAIGGGGGSGPSRDSCPVQRDCSDSYYDRLCGPCPLIDKKPVHKSPDKVPGSITGSKLSTELKDAYKRAYGYDITTMDTIQKANMNGPLLRKDMAKMISNFATNIMNKDISTGVRCEFDDMRNLPKETQYYAIAACRLGLMGYESDGIRTKHTFDPEQIVDRAQFGTILSRLIRGEKNNGGDIYYQKHLDALKQEGIMTKIDTPLASELRGRVMVMMKRVFDKK